MIVAHTLHWSHAELLDLHIDELLQWVDTAKATLPHLFTSN